MKTTLATLLFLMLLTVGLKGQELDSLTLRNDVQVEEPKEKVKAPKLKKKRKAFYDPKIASRRSALLPGLGQIYNDSWWKVPILYAGLGLTVYYIDFNNRQRIEWETLAKELIAQQEAGQTIDTNALRVYRRRADTWRKNRDLLYLVTLGVYVLNIAEAAIDAHLKGFDVGENLGQLKPKLGVISNGAPYLGVGFTIPIGSK